ncbi:MAG TPA: ribonuclease P, partial [Methanosarcinales archaeon]|nr:ribonuclease P [Methanosarcinales archaeon]
MRRNDKKVWIRDMAAQRMVRLFDLAEVSFDDDPGLSKRYVSLARRIGMRHRVRLPPHLKRKVCKRCGAYLVPGTSCR